MIGHWSRVAAAVLSCGLGAAACSQNVGEAQTVEPQGSSTAAAQTSAPPRARMGAALPDFASLVEQYGPAVVNVSVVGRQERTAEEIPGAPGDPLHEFFRRFGQPMPRGNMPPARGEGSGFIVSPDGYILTNAHVVGGEGSEVTVRTTDRREYSAKVVGVDERTDVAVLKIDAKGMPTVRIGDPSKLRPGEWVIAIGSPFGFENSVTAGIVSATARSMPGGDSNYAPFIQTDVAVNPGNSGGPLFNMNGEVVGINSQIYSRTGGYMGLSFAIPIDVASDVRDQLIKTGRVVRSRIGVSIQDVNAQLADSFGLDRPRGALVSMVERGAPGEEGGIKPGDVILKVDDATVERSAEVPGLIAAKKPGSKVSIEVWRDGSTKRLTVRPEELREQGQRVASSEAPENDEAARLGLVLRPLAPEERRQTRGDGSLLVEDVQGPAAEAGVRPGDIILGVNGKPVKSVEELRDAAKNRKGKVVALLIERGEAQLFFPLRVG